MRLCCEYHHFPWYTPAQYQCVKSVLCWRHWRGVMPVVARRLTAASDASCGPAPSSERCHGQDAATITGRCHDHNVTTTLPLPRAASPCRDRWPARLCPPHNTASPSDASRLQSSIWFSLSRQELKDFIGWIHFYGPFTPLLCQTADFCQKIWVWDSFINSVHDAFDYIIISTFLKLS